MNSDYSAMIFAAGLGTRMAPLTDDTPKPLIEVAGRPLIDHALELVADAGTIVVNTHYLAPQVERHLAARSAVTIHEPVLLDTGGGLKNALPLLGRDVAVTLNSDAVWRGENPVSALRSHWDPSRMEALLCLIPHARATGHPGGGDFGVGTQGRLTRGAEYIYTGLQILNCARLRGIESDVFSLNRVWDMMARDGGLFGMVYTGHWCDVGQPSSIALAEAMLDV